MVLDTLVHPCSVLGCCLGMARIRGKETKGLPTDKGSQEEEKEEAVC